MIVWVDVDEEEEADEDESISVLMCGWEGKYLFNGFKGVLITNFWTPSGNSSLFSNKGFKFDNNDSPKGTFYYILNLNDPDYPEPLYGYLYFTK